MQLKNQTNVDLAKGDSCINKLDKGAVLPAHTPSKHNATNKEKRHAYRYLYSFRKMENGLVEKS